MINGFTAVLPHGRHCMEQKYYFLFLFSQVFGKGWSRRNNCLSTIYVNTHSWEYIHRKYCWSLIVVQSQDYPRYPCKKRMCYRKLICKSFISFISARKFLYFPLFLPAKSFIFLYLCQKNPLFPFIFFLRPAGRYDLRDQLDISTTIYPTKAPDVCWVGRQFFFKKIILIQNNHNSDPKFSQ